MGPIRQSRVQAAEPKRKGVLQGFSQAWQRTTAAL